MSKERQVDVLKVMLHFTNPHIYNSAFNIFFRNQNQESVWEKKIVQTPVSLFTCSNTQDLVCAALFSNYLWISLNCFLISAFTYFSSVLTKINLPDLKSEHKFLRQNFHSFSHFTLGCTMPV